MTRRISQWRRANEQLLLNCLDTEDLYGPKDGASGEDKESDGLSGS